VAEAGSIRVLQQVLVEGVVRGWSGEACQYVVVTAFGIRADVACLPAPAPIGVAGELRSLYSRFCQLGRASIRFSSASKDRQRATSFLWVSRLSKVTAIFSYSWIVSLLYKSKQ